MTNLQPLWISQVNFRLMAEYNGPA